MSNYEEAEPYTRLNLDDELGERDEWGDVEIDAANNPWDELMSDFPRRGGGVSLWSMHVCERKANQAIVLCQVIYWCRNGRNGRVRTMFSHRGGVGKSYAELADEVGLSAKMVRTAVQSLVERGFLDRGECTIRRRTTSLLIPKIGPVREAIVELDAELICACRGTM